MIAAQRRHHGAAASAGRQNGAAHRVPNLHEGNGAGRDAAGTFRKCAARPQGGEIDADAAAMLHRNGAFLQGAEDAGNRVIDPPHDKAIEQRDFAGSSCACLNPAAGKEFAILQDAEEAILPERRVLGCDSCERARDSTPSN